MSISVQYQGHFDRWQQSEKKHDLQAMDNFGNVFSKCFKVTTGIIVLLAIIRILLCAWHIIVPHSVTEYIVSNLTPSFLDLGLWAFLWYIVLEIWWIIRMLIITAIFSAVVGLIFAGRWWKCVIGVVAAIAFFWYLPSMWNEKDGVFNTPKMQIKGVRDHTYSFEQRGNVLQLPTEAERNEGAIGRAVVIKDAPVYAERSKEKVVGHLAVGDTITLITCRSLDRESESYFYTDILYNGKESSIMEDVYSPLTQEVEFKDFIQQLF